MKKILVVDDEPDIMSVVSFRLTKSGYKVLRAQSGKKALELMKKDKPDLVVLDIVMPVMDGYETCRAIKEDKDFKEIPVIFLTVKREENVKEEMNGYNADDYLMKPFDAEELIKKIKKFV